jgi:CubicO group peptidase (beta-lactamase class C family)
MRNRTRQVRLGAVLAVAVLAAALALPAQPDRFEPVRERIREVLREQPVPSIAVAVAQDGKMVWEEGFGWADRENRIPATAHTTYSLASISKPITTTALMVLAERGRVDLDRPVNDYLGEAKLRARVGDASAATLHRVANHSSGLPLHYQFFYEDEPPGPPSMDETILRYGVLMTAPGERYQYSNIGYGVLDYVIERASGKSYADFLREEVFLPLGMTRSAVGLPARLVPHAAVRYNRQGEPLPFYDFDHRGASAVFASAHDLARFGMFHLKTGLADQRAILSEAAIDQMQQPTMGDYGIGWSSHTRFGPRLVSHSGGMPGVTTILWLFPEQRTAIVVLSNTSGAPVGTIGREVVSALFPDARPPQGNPSSPASEFAPGPELAGAWSGAIHTWQGERRLEMRIAVDGTVHVQLAGQLWTLLNQAAFRDGYLTGRLRGDIGTADAGRRPHILQFTLRLRGEVLNGQASTISIPGPRGGNALTYWAELRRLPAE